MNQGLLNRRYLRVKVFQALYAHSQSNNDVLIGEKHMMKSITEVVELYLYQLRLVLDLRDMALSNIEQNKLKRLPTEDDLNPNLRFVENRLLLILEENEALRRAFNKYKVSWRNESDNVKKLWKSIRSSESYLNYMNAPETNFEKDRAFLIALYRNTIVQYEALHHFLEDRSIYWLDDLSVVATQVIKTLKGLKP